MKLEVGMYVRTKNGMKIGKIAQIHKAVNHKSWYELKNGLRVYSYEKIKEPSYNIIDILEIGDYVNSKEVIEIYQAGNKFKGSSMYSFREKTIELDNDNYETIPQDCLLTNEDIKSVITHEQMEQMAYKVGE